LAKLEKGVFKEAIKDFDETIMLNPQYAYAFNNRASAKYKLKDYEGAVADCDKAISLDKNYAAAYLNRGIAYEMLRKEDIACEDRNKAAELGLKNGKTLSQQICN